MASAFPNVNQYYRYRMFINCQGGGFQEDYALNLPCATPTTYPVTSVLQVMKNLYCLRGQLLDGNSKMANAELSIETQPGINPAEGFNVPHGVPNSYPILLNDPTTQVIEPVIGVAIDPGTCMAFRFDTQVGYTELRTLRCMRASWVNQWGTLSGQINAQIGAWGQNPPNPTIANTTFPGGTTNPASCIAYFMVMVLKSTLLIQNTPTTRSFGLFNAIPWASPNSVNSPVVYNPILQPILTYRKVGEGWPKTRGKMQTFGTHG